MGGGGGGRRSMVDVVVDVARPIRDSGAQRDSGQRGFRKGKRQLEGCMR